MSQKYNLKKFKYDVSFPFPVEIKEELPDLDYNCTIGQSESTLLTFEEKRKREEDCQDCKERGENCIWDWESLDCRCLGIFGRPFGR